MLRPFSRSHVRELMVTSTSRLKRGTPNTKSFVHMPRSRDGSIPDMACHSVTEPTIQRAHYTLTSTDSNSGLHREFWSDLTASSAVNLPMSNASLRLVVISIGVESTRCTYSAARVPRRFTFTTNLVTLICACSYSFARNDQGNARAVSLSAGYLTV